MKIVQKWMKPLLCFAMFIMLASCRNVYIPNESTVENMSVKEARKVLATVKYREGSGAWIYPGDKSNRIANVRPTSRMLIVTDISGNDSVFIFSELPEIYVIDNSRIVFRDSYPWALLIEGKGEAVANALGFLKLHAIKAKRESDEYDASFAASLTDYRKKAVSNTPFPEEANRYKVQAEGAVGDKQFEEAADLYAEALKIAPWWPVGHFNRALVLGEIGDYEMAIREMKRYLQLVPDAPNARAAQEQMYKWERKAKEGN